jgi:hypothetical protein
MTPIRKIDLKGIGTSLLSNAMSEMSPKGARRLEKQNGLREKTKNTSPGHGHRISLRDSRPGLESRQGICKVFRKNIAVVCF